MFVLMTPTRSKYWILIHLSTYPHQPTPSTLTKDNPVQPFLDPTYEVGWVSSSDRAVSHTLEPVSEENNLFWGCKKYKCTLHTRITLLRLVDPVHQGYIDQSELDLQLHYFSLKPGSVHFSQAQSQLEMSYFPLWAEYKCTPYQGTAVSVGSVQLYSGHSRVHMCTNSF